ncbi:LuxR C-terminal-related transcriptional regulator [Streptomyces flavofungini]|uniref:LuxR C-terminal-related transcriptional regulator n=1 Tax=Streptomyces flavofungini TaxID=68200 RepID=UPI0034DDFFBA
MRLRADGGQIDVLIAEARPMMRTGLGLILAEQPDINVVGEAADGLRCLELARALRPRVVLANYHMPRLDGSRLVRELSGPGVPQPVNVVLMAASGRDEEVCAAVRDGARGYLLHNASPTLLAEAVRAAACGDVLISPALAARLMERLALAERAVVPPRRPAVELSGREGDVMRLVALGHTNAEIGDALSLSLSSVKTYLARIMTKLKVRNRVEIAAWAWEHERARVSG